MKDQFELTRNVGWEFGLSKTVHYSKEFLWDFMFSEKGLRIWLGELGDSLEIQKPFKTREGVEGYVRIFSAYSHIRMNWKRVPEKIYQLFKSELWATRKKGQ